jgi:hypothetical protein
MNSSEDLRRHAVECSQMATFLRNKENKSEWISIAERYIRFAKWCDARSSLTDHLKHLKKQKYKNPQTAARTLAY